MGHVSSRTTVPFQSIATDECQRVYAGCVHEAKEQGAIIERVNHLSRNPYGSHRILRNGIGRIEPSAVVLKRCSFRSTSITTYGSPGSWACPPYREPQSHHHRHSTTSKPPSAIALIT